MDALRWPFQVMQIMEIIQIMKTVSKSCQSGSVVHFNAEP